MEETLGALGIMILLAILPIWMISGYLGAAWLMYKGYTMEMLGCLGLFAGTPLILMAIFGPIILAFAWALPSRTDPSQQGGVKQMLTPKATHKSVPTAPTRSGAPPKRPAISAPSSRRPQIPGSAGTSRPAIPASRPTNNRERPKPPVRRE